MQIPQTLNEYELRWTASCNFVGGAAEQLRLFDKERNTVDPQPEILISSYDWALLKYAANDTDLTEWELQPRLGGIPLVFSCVHLQSNLWERWLNVLFIHLKMDRAVTESGNCLVVCTVIAQQWEGGRVEWRFFFFFFPIKLLFIHTLIFRKQLHAKWNVFSVDAVERLVKNEGNLIACVALLPCICWKEKHPEKQQK